LSGQETHGLDTCGNKISNRKEIDNNNFCVYLLAILIDKYDKAGSLAIAVWNLLHTVSPSDLSLFFGHTLIKVVTTVRINSAILMRNRLFLFLFYIITNLR
jgi:hypothetical protein